MTFRVPVDFVKQTNELLYVKYYHLESLQSNGLGHDVKCIHLLNDPNVVGLAPHPLPSVPRRLNGH